MPERDDTAIIQLKVRMREPLRAQLEQAAQGTGHSMNSEIIKRLERSFERQDLADEMLEATYGRELAGLLMVLGRTMRDVGTHAGFREKFGEGKDWFEVPYAFDQTAKAAETIIEACRPDGDTSMPRASGVDGVDAMLANLGEGVAATNLSSIVDPEQGRTGELKEWGRKVHDKLGPLVSVIKSRLGSPDMMIVPVKFTSKEEKS